MTYRGYKIKPIPICKYCGMEADYGNICTSCKTTRTRVKKLIITNQKP